MDGQEKLDEWEKGFEEAKMAKMKYDYRNFNPQKKSHKESKAEVLCPNGHCLYPRMKYGTLGKKGIRPTKSQWARRERLVLSGAQYKMIGRECKHCVE